MPKPPTPAPDDATRPLSERVLSCVEQIPPGKVLAYSDVAEFVGTKAARNVGRIMAAEGGSVPWHRVVRADGSLAPHIRAEQLARLRAEGVAIRGERVDMSRARWDGR
ncbi:MGMT family protein [Jatrophihabitans telluris]|uniref:MGMT family protein n=1 Tax=Jatrophihabitans telluris TaxID=2038343 RepID=A0ABY4R1C8_9ACTN|nr:MGMT family protein [Jatrophihabitans telluris]UQX89718.1 MGMT family protein [Jatrophihabitans telluris]